ncbi:unnamed protein product [Paramecium pentaurelia]|uniref:Transmembrane protein n=1 Tax=Paramecium pentaurelia TaxID=43138 RepID=A0A8S1WYL7_9CILI|nr:unnamed protein product [Paramecium pentaurelia]
MNQIFIENNLFLNVRMEQYYNMNYVMMIIEQNLMVVIDINRVVKQNAYYFLKINAIYAKKDGNFKSISVNRFVEVDYWQFYLTNNMTILEILILLIVNINMVMNFWFVIISQIVNNVYIIMRLWMKGLQVFVNNIITPIFQQCNIPYDGCLITNMKLFVEVIMDTLNFEQLIWINAFLDLTQNVLIFIIIRNGIGLKNLRKKLIRQFLFYKLQIKIALYMQKYHDQQRQKMLFRISNALIYQQMLNKIQFMSFIRMFQLRIVFIPFFLQKNSPSYIQMKDCSIEITQLKIVQAYNISLQ